MIRISNLSKRYGQLVALNKLDLEVPEGETLGFIGPNGAGKTTTIRILATLLEATGGTAEVCGKNVRRQPHRVRELIGYMPDFCGVYEDMRVLEYLHFFAAAYGIGHAKAAGVVRDVLQLTDLAEKADAPAHSLSRGMQQRLQLARVLLHDPKVLLLDEPASGLDPRARIEIRMLLKELRAMGKTILISSHILVELAEICTSIAIIERGNLLYHGNVADALTAARQLRGAAIFIGVEGRMEEARAVLEGLEGVRGARICGEVIEVEIDREVHDWTTAEFFDVMVERGFRLNRLEDEKASLEDAFLHLTKGAVQ